MDIYVKDILWVLGYTSGMQIHTRVESWMSNIAKHVP